MEQFYKPVKDFFNQKVYIVLYSTSPKIDAICKTEQEAVNHIKSQIDNNFFNYRQPDIEAIENKDDKEFYESSRDDAINFISNYKILTVFGVDINKRIYKIITPNEDIYDIDFVVTNNLEEWKQKFKTEEDPDDFYYFDYNKYRIIDKKFEF